MLEAEGALEGLRVLLCHFSPIRKLASGPRTRLKFTWFVKETPTSFYEHLRL